jgi:hypothetical protein
MQTMLPVGDRHAVKALAWAAEASSKNSKARRVRRPVCKILRSGPTATAPPVMATIIAALGFRRLNMLTVLERFGRPE